MLIMRPKKDPDAVVIQVLLWVIAIGFGAASLTENVPLNFWCLSVPCVVVSIVYALYPRGRRIVVSEDGIESVSFFVFRRFVPWDCVISYREKEKKGDYSYNVNWTTWLLRSCRINWIEGSFRLKVSVTSGLPLYVSNGYTEYKQFKKRLREKGVPRIKAKKK